MDKTVRLLFDVGIVCALIALAVYVVLQSERQHTLERQMDSLDDTRTRLALLESKQERLERRADIALSWVEDQLKALRSFDSRP